MTKRLDNTMDSNNEASVTCLPLEGTGVQRTLQPQMPIFILTTTSCYINKLRWLSAHLKILQGKGVAKLLNYKYTVKAN